MLPPPCFTVGMVPGFLQTWRSAFRPNSSILLSSDQRILFLMAVMCLLRSAAEMVVLLEASLISTDDLYSSVIHHQVLGHLPAKSKPFLPRWLNLAGQPALGRVLVVSNFFHLRMMEATVLLGNFTAAEIFSYPSTDLCLTQSCLGALWTIPSTSWLGFCSDMNCQLWGLI